MSYKIEGTRITLTRGDTFSTTVTIGIKGQKGEVYKPTANDTIRFALKSALMTDGNRQFVDTEPLILKNIPYDTMNLVIDSSDTKPLDFGNYKYDIEITFEDGEVVTFIDNADFIITPEVH